MAGFIYIVQAGDTYRFKVGRSVNLPQRMRTLQLGSPTPIHLVGWFEGDNPQRDEAAWHRLLGINRRHGEWFDLSYENLLRIAAQCQALGRIDPPPPPLFEDGHTYYLQRNYRLAEVQVVDRDREDPSMVEIIPDAQDVPPLLHESLLRDDPRGALLAQVRAREPDSEAFHRRCGRVTQDARAVVETR